MERCEKFVIR